MYQNISNNANLLSNGFGERIKEERQRLKLNQADFAELARVSRASQAHYEREHRVPDLNYLAALFKKVDVPYIISGERGSTHGAKEIDPSVIEPILVAINTWATENKKSITETLRAELLALFLHQASSTGKIETDWMRKTLRLVK